MHLWIGMRTTSIREQLLQHRSAVLARYHGVRELAEAELSERDPEEIERATEQWDAQVLSRLSDSDAQALEDIVAALRRIDDGTYGMCTDCGEWIGKARLQALPTATTCIECSRDAERIAPPPFKRGEESVP